MKDQKDLTQDQEEFLSLLEDSISQLDFSILSNNKKKMNKYREIFTNKHDQVEQSASSLPANNYRVNSSLPKWDEKYFKRMGFKDYKFRNQIVKTYLETIEILDKQLGFNLPADEREEFQKELLSTLQPIVIEFENGSYTLTPEKVLHKLKSIRSAVISDYKIALELLMEIVTFQQPTKPTTVFDFSQDTIYVHNGDEVKVSSNALYLHDVNFYKGMLKTYKELKLVYSDNFKSDIWYYLCVFDELLSQTPLTDEEYWIAHWTKEDLSVNEIREKYEQKFNKDFVLRTYYNRINKTIPRKILNTYLDSVDEWLYTYKLKGKYKQCSSCGEIKLISNDRYFSPNPDSKDGFYSKCKKCSALGKSLQKKPISHL